MKVIATGAASGDESNAKEAQKWREVELGKMGVLKSLKFSRGGCQPVRTRQEEGGKESLEDTHKVCCDGERRRLPSTDPETLSDNS